ncbi:MAG TPA: hypothetical protein VM253_11270 [Candidatus Limnocylindrales bacterium]|jgi:hypothetical protein|nr:hypothetical protein [Candidatus Limnocylindrales bacterium]
MAWRGRLIGAGAGLALLIAGKFTYLLVEGGFDIARAPVAFLLPLVVLIVGLVLTGSGRRSGALIVAVVALLLLPVFGMAVFTHGLSQQTPADAALVFIGVPLALLAIVSAAQLWRRRAGDVATI